MKRISPMENSLSLSPSDLSPVEIARLQPALAAHYPDSRGVLGSQLGAFVRGYLDNPDLKGRFGGLREFVARHFPTQIFWRGRQGLDDLYDLSFAAQDTTQTRGTWHLVAPEPSAALWSAATNPSIYVQFAWSSKEKSLFQASLGIPLDDGLTAVEKLTRDDYRSIATEFVNSLESMDSSGRAKALESSGSAGVFINLMRDMGLLSRWEEFRINRASREFAKRLAAVGAEI